MALRRMLKKGAKTPGTYLPGRRPGDRLQVITVINFKCGSGKTTTAAHLAQKLTARRNSPAAGQSPAISPGRSAKSAKAARCGRAETGALR